MESDSFLCTEISPDSFGDIMNYRWCYFQSLLNFLLRNVIWILFTFERLILGRMGVFLKVPDRKWTEPEFCWCSTHPHSYSLLLYLQLMGVVSWFNNTSATAAVVWTARALFLKGYFWLLWGGVLCKCYNLSHISRCLLKSSEKQLNLRSSHLVWLQLKCLQLVHVSTGSLTFTSSSFLLYMINWSEILWNSCRVFLRLHWKCTASCCCSYLCLHLTRIFHVNVIWKDSTLFGPGFRSWL